VTVVDKTVACERMPIRGDLLAGPLSDLERVTLAGTRCSACGETCLGKSEFCPNCGRDTVSQIPLGTRGTLWTYTVVRHRPPGNYKGPEPFTPFGLGLVELPEGVRVLAPVRCGIEKLKIGLALRFRPVVGKESDGREVISFVFEPVD